MYLHLKKEQILQLRNLKKLKMREKLLNCACTHPCNLGSNLAHNPELESILPPWSPAKVAKGEPTEFATV